MTDQPRLHDGDHKAWARALKSRRLTDGFKVTAVLADDPAALAFVRDALEADVEHFELIEPADQVHDQLRQLIDQYRDLKTQELAPSKRPVLWFQRPDYDKITWGKVIQYFNVNREGLKRDLPFFWVLAGPQEMQDVLKTTGADLWSITQRVHFKHKLIKPRPKAKFPWLHLADLRFQAGEQYNSRTDLAAFLRHLQQHAKDPDWCPRAVVVTGSIASSGKPEEYKPALDFFRRIGEITGLSPQKDFFLSPGPGDINGAAISLPVNALRNTLNDQKTIELYTQDPNTMTLLNAGLEAFGHFTDRLLGPARAFSPQRPWRTDVLDIDGYRVAFLQLNSVWAGAQPYRALMGEAQWRDCLEQAYDAPLRVALMYHELDQLQPFDREAVSKLMQAEDGVQLVMQTQGYQIQPQVQGQDAERTVTLRSGGMFESSQPHAFRWLHLDTEQQLRGALYKYNPYQNGRWDGDPAAEHADNFRLEWVAQTREEVSSTHADAFEVKQIKRYREVAAAYHGMARFLGLAEDAPKPNTRIGNLFVPLRMHRHGLHDDERSLGTHELAHRIYNQERASRWVILGDPGAGKSSLCRYLTVLFAGEIALDDFNPNLAPLPILVPFRDYVAESAKSRQLSLLDYIERQVEQQLQLELPEGLLVEQLERGNAVVLFDGMDEVGTPQQRAQMRDRLQAFSRRFNKATLIVTSRPMGYDDAPLDQSPEFGFEHWELRPFDEEEQKQFITRWYAIMEAQDGMRARERALELTKRLDEVPAARELASNPLLATILALVHYYTLKLPGERAKLYERCVETLLKSWPASRGKLFEDLRFGDQLKVLATIALEMQEAKIEQEEKEEGEHDQRMLDSGGLQLWQRSYLLKRMAAKIRTCKCEADPDEVADRFLRFLLHESGLWVELRAGYVSFYHRSLMEYMAAVALIEKHRGASENLGCVLAALSGQKGWYEVTLLAVGIVADDRQVMAKLYQELSAKDDWDSWHFLLACLGEEACLGEHLETIALQIGRLWIDKKYWDPVEAVIVRHRVLNYSRQGKALRKLICERLADEMLDLDTLRVWLTFAWDIEPAKEVIKQRKDDIAIKTILTFFPGTEIGDQTVLGFNAEQGLDLFLISQPVDELLWSCFTFLKKIDETVVYAAMSLAFLKSNGVTFDLWHKQAHVLDQDSCSGNRKDMKEGEKQEQVYGVLVRPLEKEIYIQPYSRKILCKTGGHVFESRSSFSRYFSSRSTFDISGKLTRFLGDVWLVYFTIVLSGILSRDFSRDFSKYFAEDVVPYLVLGFAELTPRDFIKQFKLDWYTWSQVPRLSPNYSQENPWKLLLEKTDREEIITAFPMIYMPIFTEIYIGFTTTVGMPDEQRGAYIQLRSLNRWLWTMWEGIDKLYDAHLPPALENEDPDNPPAVSLEPVDWPGSPYTQALYLAMGWSQCNTTWLWPHTPRWRACMQAPPRHWLPRAHWHFCYLMYDENDPDHLAALRRAIAEGRKDPDLPGYADTFASYLTYDL